jgi:hypothetical protein
MIYSRKNGQLNINIFCLRMLYIGNVSVRISLTKLLRLLIIPNVVIFNNISSLVTEDSYMFNFMAVTLYPSTQIHYNKI